MKKAIVLGAAALLAAACQSAGPGQTIGGLGGAAAGGLVGSQIGEGSGQLVATAAGTLIGAWLGASLGAQFDQQDNAAFTRANQQALATGQTTQWQSQTGGYGTVTPTSDVYVQGGRQCRNYTQTMTKDGRTYNDSGVACLNNSGSWVKVR